jgi:PAS domain S-box-containing protein
VKKGGRGSGLGALQAYIGGLGVLLAAILVGTLVQGQGFGRSIAAWAAFSALFAVSESVDIFFHHERGRQSLNPSVAILLPMVVFLSFSEVMWGVATAMFVVRILHWREGALKFVFNVAQYGCAAAAAAGVWHMLGSGGDFGIADAGAAALSVVVFEGLTHVFVAGAISLAERRPFAELLRTVVPMSLPYLAGNTLVGLVLAAAYDGAHWTWALSPLLLALLYMASRAVLRQGLERERLEHLHAATMTLAAGWDLDATLVGFLRSVIGIMSAAEAHVIVRTDDGLRWSGVRGEQDLARMMPLEEGPLLEPLSAVRWTKEAVVVAQDDTGRMRAVAHALGVRSLVVAPLLENEELAGCLVVCDRVGADEFGPPDARFLQALADELVLILDSYRLFFQVTEERERFRRIFEGSKEGICLLDEHGVVRAWNPALKRISRREENDVIGEVFWDALDLRDKDGTRLWGEGVIRGLPERELELVRADGSNRWVALSPGPLQKGEGGDWVVLVRDITAVHEIEMAKSDFLSTVSHEFRTPLTGIKGSLDVLGGRMLDLPPGAERMVGVARWGAQRLERLIMNLLLVSEIETGRVPIKTEELKLEELVRERVESTLEGDEAIEVVVDGADLTVTADRERLGLVIDHLLENALKFGGRGGKITVRIARTDGHASLSVSDQGPGIPEDDQDRIFERFVRLGDVMTRSSQGAGIGLFIAKRSMDAMGGSIWVESRTGQGATFYITVPLAASVNTSPEDSPTTPSLITTTWDGNAHRGDN